MVIQFVLRSPVLISILLKNLLMLMDVSLTSYGCNLRSWLHLEQLLGFIYRGKSMRVTPAERTSSEPLPGEIEKLA